MKYLITIILVIILSFEGTIHAQNQPEVVLTTGHISNVLSVNFSPNNKFVVTGAMDKTIRIWDRSIRQEFRVLNGHKGQVWMVEYTADSKYIMSLDGKGEFIVWEHATGQIINKIDLKTHNRYFNYVPKKNGVLTKADGNELKLLDIFTGKELQNYGEINGAGLFEVLSGKENYLMKINRDSNYLIDIIDYESNKIVQKLKSNNTKDNWRVTSNSKDGKYLAAYTIQGDRVVVWDINTGERINDFDITLGASNRIVKMIFTIDNKELITLGGMGEANVYDVKTGKLKREMNKTAFDMSTPEAVEAMQTKSYRYYITQDLAMSPDNRILAIAATIIDRNVEENSNETITGAILFDYKNDKELGLLKGHFKLNTHLSVAPNSKYMVSSVINKYPGLRVWNMNEGQLERYIPTNGLAAGSGDESKVAAWVIAKKNKDKSAMFLDPNGMELTVFDAKRMKPIFKSTAVKALRGLALNYDGSILVTEEVDVNLKNPMANQFFFRVWDVAAQKEIKRINFKSTEVPLYQGTCLSPDGKYIIALTNGSKALVWDRVTGDIINEIPMQIAYDYLLDFVPNSNRILISHTEIAWDATVKKVTSHFEWYEWDYVTGEKTGLFTPKRNAVLCAGKFSRDGNYLVTGQDGYHLDIGFSVIVWDWATKTPICELNGHNGAVREISFDEKSKKIFTAGDDGFIKIWDFEACKLSASFIAQGKIDYIILSPNNYYKASKGNNEGIGFRYKSNFYTFDQFDIQFNRPDKVLADLGVSKYSTKLYEKAWEKRLKRVGFVPEDFDGNISLPAIKIIDKDLLPIHTKDSILKLNIEAWDEVAKLDRLVIYVNDVPIPLQKGISLKKVKEKKVQKELKLALSEGSNLIKISAFNRNGLESLRETFELFYEPNVSQKPNLYMLSIGVSEFEDKERNLKFAVKDASDLVNKFKENSYFGKAITKEFYNQEATAKNIKRQATQFLKQAGVNDQIIVYISSHGLLDDSLDYYLAMHDVDFDKPNKKGLSYDIVNEMLDGVDCRNRLVMIDACHSGEVDKDDVSSIQKFAPSSTSVKARTKSGTTLIRPKAGLKNSFNYMKILFNDVSKGTGATVISAAGGFEFALESDDWNNGVFTYAILAGMTENKETNHLNADLDLDGTLTVSELKNYVTVQVTKLTNGKQHPTTRSENAINDPILFQSKK